MMTLNPVEPSDTMNLQRFDFETVMINQFGEVIERRVETAVQFTEYLNGRIPLDMVRIPSGTYLMGSPPGLGDDDECPQHSVRITPFYAGKFPVTQEQWAGIMDWIPPYRCQGAKRPVDRVSWEDAQTFCARLSARTGRPYRLLSEAEWEYACRARTNTPFYCGQTITTDLANYVGEHLYYSEPKGIYRHVTTDAGSFPPNGFGLYDMSGNVWEWCADVWHDNYEGAPVNGRAWESETEPRRVLRGGCWHDTPNLCRSASRLKHPANEGEDYFGFRIALTSLEQEFTNTPQDTQAHPLPAFQQIKQHLRTWFRR